ncbi:hypothetical protein ACJX0J_036209, partial [Zea mays]
GVTSCHGDDCLLNMGLEESCHNPKNKKNILRRFVLLAIGFFFFLLLGLGSREFRERLKQLQTWLVAGAQVEVVLEVAQVEVLKGLPLGMRLARFGIAEVGFRNIEKAFAALEHTETAKIGKEQGRACLLIGSFCARHEEFNLSATW